MKVKIFSLLLLVAIISSRVKISSGLLFPNGFPTITFGNSHPEPEPESEPESEPETRYEPRPEPRHPEYHHRPKPEPEPFVIEKPIPTSIRTPSTGLSLKFDLPSVKFQLPAFRLPGVSLKATIKNPPIIFRLLPQHFTLPSINLGAGVSVSGNTHKNYDRRSDNDHKTTYQDEGSAYYHQPRSQSRSVTAFDKWLTADIKTEVRKTSSYH